MTTRPTPAQRTALLRIRTRQGFPDVPRRMRETLKAKGWVTWNRRRALYEWTPAGRDAYFAQPPETRDVRTSPTRLRARARRERGNGIDYHVVDLATGTSIATVDKYSEALALRLERRRVGVDATVWYFNGRAMYRGIFRGDIHAGWRKMRGGP